MATLSFAIALTQTAPPLENTAYPDRIRHDFGYNAPSMKGKELQFVQWLKAHQCGSPSLPLGIGDDMAMLCMPVGEMLIAADMLLDGVHFDSARHDLASIGYKAIACNLSDCAAMAVKPLAATVSAAFPDHWPAESAQRIFEGINELAAVYDVAIAGGDTTVWDKPLVIDVAIVAVPFDGIAPVRRSGARVGDALFVTGTLGGSLSGKHLNFKPRVNEAKILAEEFGEQLHAMMDLSDGLGLDLRRMCDASGVGARLDEEALRSAASNDAKKLARESEEALIERVLFDGEDFELLLAVANGVDVGEVAARASISLTRVGHTSSEPSEIWIETANGKRRTLPEGGYVH